VPPVIEIGWAGDTTLGSKYGQPPEQGRALFSQVRGLLSQPNVMIVNLEGTLSVGGPSKSDGRASSASFSFQAPPANAEALSWAGVDVVSLANNHAYDYFKSGLDQTERALTKEGVKYTGLPGQITMIQANGISVTVLGFSPYSWNASLTDIAKAQDLVRQAASEADLVVVLMHAGAEGSDQIHTPQGAEYAYGEFRGRARSFAHAVVDAGADLVLGSGPHVLRGIERYKGRLIAYSLGNLAGWGNFGLAGNLGLSGLLTVRLDRSGNFLGGHWYSLRLAKPGVPKNDPGQASLHLVQQLSREDFSDTFPLSEQGVISAR
jgi:Bacterial capsule synthesis protein PGA_cap